MALDDFQRKQLLSSLDDKLQAGGKLTWDMIKQQFPVLGGAAEVAPAALDAASTVAEGTISPNTLSDRIGKQIAPSVEEGAYNAFTSDQDKALGKAFKQEDEQKQQFLPPYDNQVQPNVPDMTAPTTPAPTTPVAPSTPAPMASKPATDPLDVITSNDKTARDAEMERERKNHKLGAFAVAGGSIADALGNAASAFGGKGSTTAAEDALNGITDTETRDKARFEDKLKNDPNSDLSKSYRQMVLQIAPDMAKHPAFNSMTAAAIGDKLPLIDTMMKSQASKDAREISLKQIQSNKALMLEQQRQNHENAAVNQGIGRLAGIRGDASLARAEVQRDAAATAVNRIDEVLATGQALSPFDYTDILGQLYKARSGNGAGEQVMKEIRQPVGSAAFNKAWTYITGMQAPGTSKDISKSLREAAYSMGKQADEFHDGYMKTHLIKPAGVSDDAWSSVASTSRGSSFADNVALHQEALKKSRQSNGGSSARPAKDPGGFF